MAGLYEKGSLYEKGTLYAPTTNNVGVTNPETTSALAHPNDPYEINSILDVLLNTAALKKNYGTDDGGARLKALKDLFVERTWKPATQGDFGTVLLNQLFGLGETLDVFGNVVKAVTTPLIHAQSADTEYDVAEQILTQHNNKGYHIKTQNTNGSYIYGCQINGEYIEYNDNDLSVYENIVNSGRTVNPYKLTFDERVKAAVGLGDYGRINFNYETGDVLSDILLEVISDPTLVISAAGKAVSKAAVTGVESTLKAAMRNLDTAILRTADPIADKTAIKAALDSVAGASASETVKRQAVKYFTEKQVTIAKNEPAKYWLPGLLGDAIKETSLNNTYAVKTMSDAITLAMYYDGRAAGTRYTAKMTSELIQRSLTKRVNTMSTNVLRTLTTAGDAMNTVESVVTKAALSSSGIYPVYKIITKSPRVAGWVTNTLNAGSAANTNLRGQRSMLSYEDGLENFLRTSKTITDGIGDELALKYNPKYISQFRAQMADDLVFFNDLLGQITATNGAEILQVYKKYMQECHHGRTLAELTDSVHKVIAKLDTMDLTLNNYANYLKELAPHFDTLQTLVETTQRLNAVNNVTEKLEMTNLPQAHILLHRKNLGDPILTMRELDNMLNELTAPVAEVTSNTAQLTQSFKEDMSKLYAQYFANYAALVKEAGYDIDAINPEAIIKISHRLSERITQYHGALTRETQLYLMNNIKVTKVDDIIKTFAEMVEKDKAALEGLMKTANELQSKKQTTGALTDYTNTSPEVPLNTVLWNHELFDKVPDTSDEAITAWFAPYLEQYNKQITVTETLEDNVTSTKQIRAATHHRFRTPSVQQVKTILQTYFNTPFNSALYKDAHLNFSRFISNLANDIKTLTDGSDLVLPLESFLAQLQAVSPQQLYKHSQLLTAWEATYTFKIENLTAFNMLLNSDKVMASAQSWESGTLAKLCNALQEIPEVSEDVFDTVQAYQSAAKQLLINKRFITEINMSGLRDTTKAGLLNTLPNFWRVLPAQLQDATDDTLRRILDRTETFVQQNRQQNESLSLDFIFNRDQVKINELRKKLGLKDLSAENHIAADDLITNEYVLTELCKESERVKTALESGKKLVYFDLETQNANVHAGNVLHQAAVRVVKDGESITTTHGVTEEFIRQGYTPEQTYLDKLYPGVDYAEQLTKYCKDRCGELQDEAQAVLETIKSLWNAVQDTYDEVTKTYGATFVTHNGAGFDLPLLQKKAQQYGIDKVINVDFLSKVEMLDTLKILQEQKGYFKVTADEYATLIPIFKRYSKELVDVDAKSLFNIDTLNALTEQDPSLSKLIKKLSQHYTLSKADIDVWKQGVADTVDVLRQIKATNDTLKSTHWEKTLFQAYDKTGVSHMSVEDKALWKQYLKDTGMSDAEIQQIYGDLDGLNLSTLLSRGREAQGYAYRKGIDPHAIDNWFVGSAARIGELTRTEAMQMTRVAQRLSQYANKVYNPAIYLTQMPRLKELCDQLYAAQMSALDAAQESLFNVTRETPPAWYAHLRLENLNIQQQWALFRFFQEDVPPEIFRQIVDPNKEVNNTLYALLQSTGGVEFAARNPYLETAVPAQAVIEYTAEYNKLLNLYSNTEQFCRFLDAPSAVQEPIFDGASQLQRRALEPIVKLSESITALYKQLKDTPMVSYNLAQQEARGTDHLAGVIRTRFINSSVDDMVSWLADAKGLVIFRTGELAADEIEAFVNKTVAPEFYQAGIRSHAEGAYTYVWLTKQTGLQATFEADLKEVTYWVNGKPYKKAAWTQIDLAETTAKSFGTRLDYSLVKEADDALHFMTEGASGHSLYESFAQSDLERIYTLLPQIVRDDVLDLDTLKNPAMWMGSQYNHTVLGTAGGRKQFMPYASSRLMNNLQKATHNRVKDHGTKFVYAQAMLSKLSAVQGTKLGQVMLESPAEAAAWFKNNPELHAVALVQSKNSLGFEVKEFNVSTPEGVIAAHRANANIMTTPEFNKAWEVINQNIWSETRANTWLSLIRLFKIGYLVAPGTWMRNTMDSFIKNLEMTGASADEIAKGYATAMQDLRNYDEIVQDLMAWSKTDSFPPEEEMLAYFAGNKKMSYEYFQYLQRFFNDAAAGGEAAVYRKLNTKQQAKYWDELAQAGAITPEVLQKLKHTRQFNNITSAALQPMNEIERVARLAEYHLLIKQGLTNTKAIHLIEQTHYAYSVKSKLEQTMELFIPFYTFASRNLVYWMDMIERDPTFLVAMRDILDPIWDLEQYDREELEGSSSLQNNVASGNIPVGDTDWFFKTGFSFMDAFQILANPVEQAKARIFTPVQTVIDVLLQNASDESYRGGRQAVSNWMQKTFGLRITKEQLEDKYGEWAQTYEKLYPYKVSGGTVFDTVQNIFNVWQFVPLIGTQILRLENAGLYYDSDTVGQLLYMSGIAAKRDSWDKEDLINKREKLRYKISAVLDDNSQVREKWNQILLGHNLDPDVSLYMLDHDMLQQLWQELSDGYQSVSTQIYNLLQTDDDAVWMYSRLKASLGYSDKTLGQLPADVKEAILSILNGQTPTVNIRPLLQDSDAMTFMWKSLKRKYGYTDTPFKEIPTADLNIMYAEIAKSAITATRIMDMLQTDETTRYSYAIAKKNLGYGDLKLTQLPCDALELIEGAMVHKVYGAGVQKSHGTSYSYTPRAKKTYVKGLPSTQNKGPLYDTRKSVHPNYGQSFANKRFYYNSIYKKNYTSTGSSRMALRMQMLTPNRLNARLRQGFKYYR